MDQKQYAGKELLVSALCLFLTVVLLAPGTATTVNLIASYAAQVYKSRQTPLLDDEVTPGDLSAKKGDDNEGQDTESGNKTISAAFHTPDDILKLQTEFIKAHENTSPSGTVRERFFTTEGATDVIDAVAVKNTTETKKPDFSALLGKGPVLREINPREPLVLVFHTHTTEAYLMSDDGFIYDDYKTRSMDPSISVVRVGDVLCDTLEKNGIRTIHDTEIYDEAYTGAYDRSRKGVEAYLKQYPSVQIVLDVHRDAINNGDGSACKPTVEINGKKAAQVMIISGAEEGSVTGFPNWEQNLCFALSLQKEAQAQYSGLMRPLFFCRRKYNMDLTPCSLLLEFGSETNTLEEALYAGHLMGQVLASVVKTAADETV